ncbi:MAG: hypothetical protein ACLTCB_09710 [Merdibacter sp.]
MKKRIRCIYLCTMLIFACILSKLGYEQIIHHDAILERAMNLWQRDFAVAGTRGSILSSDGTVLGTCRPLRSSSPAAGGSKGDRRAAGSDPAGG